MSKIVASAAIRGAHSWAEEAEAALKKAIEEKGESQKLEFPETAFFLPMAYSLLGMEAKTLGDAKKIMTRARALLPPDGRCSQKKTARPSRRLKSRWTPTC